VIFTSNHILVNLSSDPFDIPMSLVVHEISFVNQNCLTVSDLAAQPEDESQSFATCSSLPYGYNNDIKQLQRRCLEYVNAVSKYPLDDVETIVGNTPEIIWEVLRAVSRFDYINPVSKKASTTLYYLRSVRPVLARDVSITATA
jgi:hypothetical protein